MRKLGEHSVLKAVGTEESLMQAILHNVAIPAEELSLSACTRPAAPCAQVPSGMVDLWYRKIDPGKVFDVELALDQAAARLDMSVDGPPDLLVDRHLVDAGDRLECLGLLGRQPQRARTTPTSSFRR